VLRCFEPVRHSHGGRGSRAGQPSSRVTAQLLCSCPAGGVPASARPFTERDRQDRWGPTGNDLRLEAPQWQLELDRWRALAEERLDKTQLRLQLEAVEAAIEALALLRLIMGSATKRVRTPTGIKEEPDWATQLKACRLVLAMAFAAVPQFRAGASQAPPDRRTLRIVP